MPWVWLPSPMCRLPCCSTQSCLGHIVVHGHTLLTGLLRLQLFYSFPVHWACQVLLVLWFTGEGSLAKVTSKHLLLMTSSG